mmetsp:Transcript_68321/g.158554  ORF Transcript_68321/g.158554 Transcript_68321/m.158554 type:complete len:266 (+) Transcript_68321:1482-2279(+)
MSPVVHPCFLARTIGQLTGDDLCLTMHACWREFAERRHPGVFWPNTVQGSCADEIMQMLAVGSQTGPSKEVLALWGTTRGGLSIQSASKEALPWVDTCGCTVEGCESSQRPRDVGRACENVGWGYDPREPALPRHNRRSNENNPAARKRTAVARPPFGTGIPKNSPIRSNVSSSVPTETSATGPGHYHLQLKVWDVPYKLRCLRNKLQKQFSNELIRWGGPTPLLVHQNEHVAAHVVSKALTKMKPPPLKRALLYRFVLLVAFCT